MNDILVSINCITYNHAKYIRKTIEGFLIQKTSFKYEILIGEDCSTDETRGIIEEYVERFPETIFLITSDHNVGARKNLRRLHEASKGKYIAICEGDDYWVDPGKLQKQIDFMEQNPECSLCFHSAKIVNETGELTGNCVRPNNKNHEYGVKDIVEGGGQFFPTASMVYPKIHMNNPPQWYLTASVGDFPLALILGAKGSVCYIDSAMSHYRVNSVSSWTKSTLTSMDKVQKTISALNGTLEILDNFNNYTNDKYIECINKAISLRVVRILFLRRKWLSLFKTSNRIHLKRLHLNLVVKLFLLSTMPSLYGSLNSFKGKLITCLSKKSKSR